MSSAGRVEAQKQALTRAAELITQQMLLDDVSYGETVGLRRAAKVCRDLAAELGPVAIEAP